MSLNARNALNKESTPESLQMAAAADTSDGVRVEGSSDEYEANSLDGDVAIVSLSTPRNGERNAPIMQLELEDGTKIRGTGFGSRHSIAGELVFQTGMVGYPEAITDPSYRGQILVITFPLVGNYGVPSRATLDKTLGDLPTHFEASQIHVAGLIVASYSGEEYSHFLATSSLGCWLEEQGVPAMYGVDTRALTKRIREKGSMLGKLLIEKPHTHSTVNGTNGIHVARDKAPSFEQIEWFNPNTRSLVADGERNRSLHAI